MRRLGLRPSEVLTPCPSRGGRWAGARLASPTWKDGRDTSQRLFTVETAAFSIIPSTVQAYAGEAES
jgi:hypothetical protein